MLLMFFLAEYLHLIIAAIHFILFFWGGWFSFEIMSLLPPMFASYHDTVFYANTFSFLTNLITVLPFNLSNS
jgi:NADH:ubiquinone oxidoreductase subunit H